MLEKYNLQKIIKKTELECKTPIEKQLECKNPTSKIKLAIKNIIMKTEFTQTTTRKIELKHHQKKNRNSNKKKTPKKYTIIYNTKIKQCTIQDSLNVAMEDLTLTQICLLCMSSANTTLGLLGVAGMR